MASRRSATLPARHRCAVLADDGSAAGNERLTGRHHPGEGWQCVKMFGGAFIVALFAAVFYALLALFEMITGRDYLNRGPKSRVSNKEKEKD